MIDISAKEPTPAGSQERLPLGAEHVAEEMRGMVTQEGETTPRQLLSIMISHSNVPY
jgi:hypothetical protein